MMRRTFLAQMAAAPLIARLAAGKACAKNDMLDSILAKTGAPALGGAVFGPSADIYLQVGGTRRAGADDPITSADLWHIGSNGKAMTAALYAHLVEQGRIPERATLGDLFPGMSIHAELAAATAEDIMAHRAGLTDASLSMPGWLLLAHADRRPVAQQRRALIEQVLAAAPTGRPANFAYANINYIVIGAAIEQATGRSWEEVIAAELFGPLRMTSAGFGPPRGDQPWGHRNGRPVDPAGMADNPPVLGPAGRIHLSLADYGHFLRVFLNDGAGWLKPETVQRLIAPPTSDSAYAHGWMSYRQRDWALGPVFAHEGSNTMWHAVTLLAPARRLAIVAVSNDATNGATAAQKLAQALTRQ